MPPFEIMERAWVYIDGSAMNADHPELARMGWAAVYVHPDGNLQGIVRGLCPAFVRSSAEAELWALTRVVEQNPIPPWIVTDCLSLVDTVAAHLNNTGSHKSVMARTWAEFNRLIDGDEVLRILQRRLW